MSGAPFHVVPFDATLNRADFHSGSERLDLYLREQVSQDVRRRVAACFVALTDAQSIAGYYTLASASLRLADLPTSMSRKLPRYPTVPAVRVGRLAIAKVYQGQGLGSALLADALARTDRSEIAAYAAMVEAKDEVAAAFYRHHGFIPLPDLPLTLFLPLATARYAQVSMQIAQQ